MEGMPDARVEQLSRLVDEEGLSRAGVNLVLPLDDYQLFQIDRPAVEEQELAAAVRFKLGDLLDYPVDEAIVDTFEFPEDASRGRGQLVNAVCARRSLLEEYVGVVQEVGLNIERIDIGELALRNIAARLDPEARGTALIYLREGHGHMVFCRGEMLYMGRRLDVSLAQLRDASTQEHAIQSLALEIQRSSDYYESQLRQVPPRVIHATGHPTALPLAGMLSTNINADVVEPDWEQVNGGEAPDSRACYALGAVLDTSEVAS